MVYSMLGVRRKCLNGYIGRDEGGRIAPGPLIRELTRGMYYVSHMSRLRWADGHSWCTPSRKSTLHLGLPGTGNPTGRIKRRTGVLFPA